MTLRTELHGDLWRGGCPPDRQEKATMAALEQANILCADSSR